MDREFLTGLVAKHVSGLELLPGSDQFDRPTSADGEVIENVLQLLSNRYEYIVVDGGAQITAASLAALYGRDDCRRDQSRCAVDSERPAADRADRSDGVL